VPYCAPLFPQKVVEVAIIIASRSLCRGPDCHFKAPSPTYVVIQPFNTFTFVASIFTCHLLTITESTRDAIFSFIVVVIPLSVSRLTNFLTTPYHTRSRQSFHGTSTTNRGSREASVFLALGVAVEAIPSPNPRILCFRN
jgi:hypothetical protein